MIEHTFESSQPVAHPLIKLADAGWTVANPSQDIRGRKVVDRGGEEIGKVDSLLLDQVDSRIRFLEVKDGGFLGIGGTSVLIPVDAIARITDDEVRVDQTREHVAGGPRYDPDLAEDSANYWGGYYSYYGMAPYWTPGYAYPAAFAGPGTAMP